MEDFYMNITSQGKSHDYSNITYDYYDYSNNTYDYDDFSNNAYDFYDFSNIYDFYDFSNNTYDYYDFSFYYFYYYFDYFAYSDPGSNSSDDEFKQKVKFIIYVLTSAIIAVGLPLTLVAIYALYSLVRNDQVAPIYVINLLIADLIQLCCMIARVATTEGQKIFAVFRYIYLSALVASVCFMVCIALERYLVVASPLWYRFRRTIKISVVVCVLVWTLDLVIVLVLYFWINSLVRYTVFGFFFLLPFPLFIFFLGGTLKALSGSISVPSDEKRRIVGLLVLVLLIYTLLFLPRIISNLADRVRSNNTLSKLSFVFLELSPLADLTLYIFMRKGTIDKLLSSVCCCRMDSDDTNISSV